MNAVKMIRVVLTAALAFVLLAGCGAEDKNPTSPGNPFLNGSKQPWEYTLEEFRAMSDEEQVAFRNSFESLDAFYEWADKAQSADVRYPWDKTGAKQPADYTWAEFEALTAEDQMAFQNSFDSFEAFDAWLQNAQYQAEIGGIGLPWENGGKQPEEYTWAEFEALTAEQQMLFQEHFESLEAFDAWLQKAQGKDTEKPWDKPGAKQPKDYTWAEFEALTGEQQMAFQNSFSRFEDFESWLQRVQENDAENPWEKPGAKQPKDYTWAEFEALTGEQQMAFQNSFSRFEDFESWLQRVQENDAENPWEKPGAKQPKDYTWAEFEALTAEQQMAFQDAFDSIEAFDAWLQRVQNGESEMPWENGGKPPEEYTWEEFQALTAEQQMRFQSSFSTPNGFEQWLDKNMP